MRLWIMRKEVAEKQGIQKYKCIYKVPSLVIIQRFG